MASKKLKFLYYILGIFHVPLQRFNHFLSIRFRISSASKETEKVEEK